MAIPDNYIDRITDIENGDRRYICPAADKVRVDNENFEGSDLDEVLDEIAEAIDDAGSGGYAPPAGGIPKTDLATAVQESLNLADSSLQPSDKTQLQGAITQLQNALNTLIGSGNVQGVIDTFNEVTAFLNGIDTDDPTLFNQLKSLSDAITALQTSLAGKISGIKANGASETLPVENGIVTLPPAGSTISPATASPSMDGTAAVGTSAKYAREDHVHPHDTSKQDALTFDNAPTAGSNNPVKSGGIKDAIDEVIPTIDPTTKKWIVGGVLTDVFAEGQDGNSGVASADGVASVNNLNGGTEDTEQKVYVLGANQGKRLADAAYRSLVAEDLPTIQETHEEFSMKWRRAYSGLGIGETHTNRCSIDGYFDLEGTDQNSLGDIRQYTSMHIPSGYYVEINYADSPSANAAGGGVIGGNPTTKFEGDVNISNINFENKRYIALQFYKWNSGHTSYDATAWANGGASEIADLESGFYFSKTVQPANPATQAINIVDEDGVTELSIYKQGASSPTEIYTKEAVDNIVSASDNGYRSAKDGEIPVDETITFAASDYKNQWARNPGVGIGTGSSNAARACLDMVFDRRSDDDDINLNGVVSLNVPNGYAVGYNQVNTTAATSSSDQYIASDWLTGTVQLELVDLTNAEAGSTADKRYVSINFKRTDNGTMQTSDITALVAGFSMSRHIEAVVTGTKAIEIVDSAGNAVKTLYNSDNEGNPVEVYTKGAVDAMLGTGGSLLRVCAWNVGHFCQGRSWFSGLATYGQATDSDYYNHRISWRKKFNEIGANILLMPEFSPIFYKGESGDGYSTGIETGDALLDTFFPYHSEDAQTQGNYANNAIYSKMALSNVSNVNYTSRGQAMYYKVATISVGGVNVKIVVTHLDWTQNETYAGYRAAQIQQLINTFKDEPYVIIGGDFNIDDADEFDAFKTAGFAMVNHDVLCDIPTFPATGRYTSSDQRPNVNNPEDYYNPCLCLDNIIVKGLSIRDVRVFDDTLSDHCAIVADLVVG